MKTTRSRFFCTCCGKEGLPVLRPLNHIREAGHLKKLYCLNCKKETNHAEIREIGGYSQEDFEKEFSQGRFVEGKRVKINELYTCSLDNCPFNHDGKCWNANNSEKCKYKPE